MSAPRRSPRRHQGSLAFTVISDTPDTLPDATPSRTQSGTKRLRIMTNVASSAGSMASSRESSVSGRASSVTAIKAEPIEISLTPATVTWSKRTSNAQNLPTTARVKSEPLDFQLPTATQTLLNKHGTSKGKKSGRVGSSKGNQNVALKTCEVDQKNGSMMDDKGLVTVPSFLEGPNPGKDLVVMDPLHPMIFHKSARFIPGAFTDSGRSSLEPALFDLKPSMADNSHNVVNYVFMRSFIFCFYAVPAAMFIFWYYGWDLRYGIVAGFASPFSFPSLWGSVTRLCLAGLIADTPLSAAAYLDIIPTALSFCLKFIAKTQAIDAISQNKALMTTQVLDELKIKPTTVSEEKVKEAHEELQKRCRQLRPSQFNDEELEAYQVLDNPSWYLWMEFYKEDPVNTMKKFMDYLQLPCPVYASHSEINEESIEGSSPIENTTPTKNRGKSCGPTIMLINGHETVAASTLSKKHLEENGWIFSERHRLTSSRNAACTGYLDQWGENSCGDITLPVHKPAAEDDLTSGIVKYLEAEREKMEKAILSLPADWKTYLGKPPPRVLLPAPYKVLKTKANCDCEYYGQEALSPTYSYKEAMKKKFPASPKPTWEEHELMRSLVEGFSLPRPEEEIIRTLPDLVDKVNKYVAVRSTYEANQVLVNKLNSTPGANRSVEWLPSHRLTGCGRRSANSIFEFLNYHNTKEASTEMVIESGTGHYIHENLFDDEMDGARNAKLKFPCHLRALGSNPKPDSYMRVPANGKLPWHPSLMPIIFVGEAKRRENGKTEAQLAAAYNPTLSLLILYYLHTRPSLDVALPNWLHLYGITYMDFGFKIYAFYPHYRFGDNPGWGFTSCLVTDRFEYIFRDGSVPDRCRALAALYRAKAHGYYVVSRLQKWDNCRYALAPFEQQAVNESYW